MTDTNPESMIAAHRAEIDAIDLQLVDLLNRRAAAAIAIGELKISSGAPLHSPQRETEVMANVLDANSGPIPNESMRTIFSTIIKVDKKAQRKDVLVEDTQPISPSARGYGWRTGGSW